MNEENDDRLDHRVDQYLADIPSVPPAADLKERILTRTTRIIRRRRWFRRSALAAAMAACYAAGAITMWRAGPHADLSISAPTGAVSSAAHPLPNRSTPPLSPEQLEWQAIDHRHAHADLFIEAGDRFLDEAQDVQSALRCYRSALAAGGNEELVFSPDDSWLLMALKSAHSKEKNHVQSRD